jgi:hypothetical protein
MTDADLARAQAGDGDALRELAGPYRAELAGRRHPGAPHAAERLARICGTLGFAGNHRGTGDVGNS